MSELPDLTKQQIIAGHAAEWSELLDVIAERRGLTAVVADPMSGASALVAEALGTVTRPVIAVDARFCVGIGELALALADATVAELAPEAHAWWNGQAPPSSGAGLRLSRKLTGAGLDADRVRSASGADGSLATAFEVLRVISDQPALLAIDHLGPMLAGSRPAVAREALGDLRTALQRSPSLDALVVDHPGGPIARALVDEAHPLFRAGERLRIPRSQPDTFVADLARLDLQPPVPSTVLMIAAELAAGVPEYTWRAIALGPRQGDPRMRAFLGWADLRRVNATQIAHKWDLLRNVHPAAQAVVVALSRGKPPHSLALASKSVDDALNRLRDVGLAWQPSPRKWLAADPLLSAYAREATPRWLTADLQPD